MADRIYNAIVLIDTPGDPTQHYATMVYNQEKQIETRMKNMIPEGDIVICCGLNSMTKYRGLVLCLVHADRGRPMIKADESKAKIECIPGRVAFDLSNWRYFSRKFTFVKTKVGGSFQSIFQIKIPDDVTIIS